MLLIMHRNIFAASFFISELSNKKQRATKSGQTDRRTNIFGQTRAEGRGGGSLSKMSRKMSWGNEHENENV